MRDVRRRQKRAKNVRWREKLVFVLILWRFAFYKKNVFSLLEFLILQFNQLVFQIFKLSAEILFFHSKYFLRVFKHLSLFSRLFWQNFSNFDPCLPSAWKLRCWSVCSSLLHSFHWCWCKTLVQMNKFWFSFETNMFVMRMQNKF